MFGLVVIVALVAAVVVGTVLGHRYRVGPPVLLILSGSLLGLIPRFGDVQIDGEWCCCCSCRRSFIGRA